jgi:nitronate monooxygenase
MSFSSEALAGKKAWKDIWGAGQGVGAVKHIQGAAELVAQLKREYAAAKTRLI